MSALNTKKLALPVLATAGLLLSVLWMAGFFNSKIAPGRTETVNATYPQPFEVKSIEVVKVESIPAGIKARETTLVSSRILARIEKIHVRAGDLINKGDPLISLENSALIAQVAQAHSQVASIQALEKEASLNLQRTLSLKQQGLAANSDLDKARANYSKLQSDLAAAKQAESEAQTALGYSEILSPIDGRVVDRSAEPGSIAGPGKPLLSLYNPLSLLVEANVREGLAVQLKLGQQVQIKLEALNKVFSAQISEMVPAADPNARSFIVKADVKFDVSLLPGMFARMNIDTGKEFQLQIPQDYVYSFGQLNMVWLVEKQQLVRRYIRLGEQQDNMIEVISGLQDGDLITQPENES
jgi:RND family efflux transporter MFP subunit